VQENRGRGRQDAEFRLLDTRIFDASRYFDVVAEYAKAEPDDILIRIPVTNRGPAPARLDLLPTLWFRNTWSWGCAHEGCWAKPRLILEDARSVLAEHVTLGRFRLALDLDPSGAAPEALFTENETNMRRIFGAESAGPFVKDAFHESVVRGRRDAVNPRGFGTKAAFHYRLEIPAGGERVVLLRLFAEEAPPDPPFGAGFERVFADRIREADELHAALSPDNIAGGAHGRPPGLRGAALVEAVLSIRRAGLARGPRTAASAPARKLGPQPRLDPALQPRCHLHARQVGVPVVRRGGTWPST
jgi:hypothetical protein